MFVIKLKISKEPIKGGGPREFPSVFGSVTTRINCSELRLDKEPIKGGGPRKIPPVFDCVTTRVNCGGMRLDKEPGGPREDDPPTFYIGELKVFCCSFSEVA